jgi:hypothetical protein
MPIVIRGALTFSLEARTITPKTKKRGLRPRHQSLATSYVVITIEYHASGEIKQNKRSIYTSAISKIQRIKEGKY